MHLWDVVWGCDFSPLWDPEVTGQTRSTEELVRHFSVFVENAQHEKGVNSVCKA